MPELVNSLECVACCACVSVCPQNAINLSEDLGHYYPRVDTELCNGCELCTRVCPITGHNGTLHDTTPLVYAAWSKNPVTRINSTSGGIFTELCRYVLSLGGSIFGAEYGDHHIVRHTRVNSEFGINSIRQSKYVESRLDNIYCDVKSDLDSGKYVLFSGTPCQNAGLKAYLSKEYDKLICVDFICRGSNMILAYKKWLEYLESEYSSAISKVWFKNKILGWNNFSTRVEFKNGKIHSSDRNSDIYMRGYLKDNLYIRPSCGHCKFKSNFRCSDITLADFWGIDKILDNDCGTSMVLVNTDLGKWIFSKISSNIVFIEKDLSQAIKKNPMYEKSVKINPKAKEFMELLHNDTFVIAYAKIMCSMHN